jgi:hypothetical protein
MVAASYSSRCSFFSSSSLFSSSGVATAEGEKQRRWLGFRGCSWGFLYAALRLRCGYGWGFSASVPGHMAGITAVAEAGARVPWRGRAGDRCELERVAQAVALLCRGAGWCARG